MQVSAGLTVLAMVLDTLSGRNPLYRLEKFFEDKDTELLLGEPVDASAFADHNVSRVLDCLYDTGTGRIFSQIAQNAIGAFALDTACAHYDTTSISVFGDYDWPDPPFQITYGYSKDKRPDLKQFLVEMFCVDRDVPIIGAARDGNASDKTLNNELLGGISRHMASHGINPGAFIYVADSAMVTRDNLKRANENGVRFFSRLPATFNECARGSYHRIQTEVVEQPKFGRGRPAKDRPRTPVGYRYQIKVRIIADDEAIAPLKMGAGCFVLVSNVPEQFQGRQWTAADLLCEYKEQYGVEKNFGFLKDPLIVNSIFLKKNERIEVLGRSPFIEVVATARDGREALDRVAELHPDVVTLDLIMPELDGIGFLQAQMARAPLPVLILSIASDSSDLALRALDAGAVDFVQKPTALATEKIMEISDELIQKVKAVAGIPMARLASLAPPPAPVAHRAGADSARRRVDVCVIGISTGGPHALKYLIPQLPADFPVPLAIVMHLPAGYTDLYAKRLDTHCALSVAEAKGGEALAAGKVYLAQAGRHLYLRRRADGGVETHLDARPMDTAHRPAVDVLFRSAAEIYDGRVLGVVMTGMGSDGREGAAWIKSKGGIVLTEAEESCVVYGMPQSVVDAGLSDHSAPLEQMARLMATSLYTPNQ